MIRQRLIAAAKAWRDQNVRPAELADSDCYLARGNAVLIRAGEPWFEATARRRTADSNPACP